MSMNDDDEDEIDNTDDSGLTQSTNPKDILQQYLLGKKGGGNTALADQSDRNALAATIASGISQAGTIGGKNPDASSVGQLAAGLNANNQNVLKQQNVEDQSRAKLAEYLMAKKQAEDMATNKLAQQRAIADQNDQRMKDIASSNQDIKKATTSAAATAHQDAAADRSDKQTNTDFDAFTKRLAGTTRDSIGNEKSKLRSTTHALAILDGMNTPEDFNKLSPMQVNELGTALAATLSPGAPALNTIQEMTPNNAAKKMSELYSYFFNEPAPANQGAFVDQFKHMLDRQKQVSSSIIQGELSPIVTNYRRLNQKDPDRFRDILQEAGGTIDENGKLTAYAPPYKMPDLKQAPGAPDSGTAIAAPAGKQVVKKQFSPSRKQTRVTYSDGSTEVLDGQQ